MTKSRSVSRFLTTSVAIGAIFASTTLSAGEEVRQSDSALEMLRQITLNPEVAHSVQVRNDALLTTGSIVKSNGKDRVLYHLPAITEGLRFAGETSSKRWPVHIAREQLRGDVTLRLAYQNAVSVMPEASNFIVEINGAMVGKRVIQSPNRSAVLSFKVPSHILVPGFNEVRVTARQRHRVDCSINSTHELWTDIDAARSGFVFGQGNSVLNSLDGIAALARNKGGQVKMRLLTPVERDGKQIARTMLLAQYTALYSDFSNALVEVAAAKGNGPGLDIFTGSMAELQEVAPQYAKVVRNDGTLQILSRDGDERVALILITNDSSSARASSTFAKRLAKLFPKRPRLGSVQGLKAAHFQRSTDVASGEKISFKDLGLQSEEFDGRLYRRAFQVNLPPDYFAADYNQAELNLATGYAKGLDRNNKFIIRVNGVTATGFAMSKSTGHVYKNKMLRLPLSAFKPGQNSIEIEAQLARAGDRTTDQPCDAQSQIEDKKSFVISGKSTLQFPRLAHLARLPNLGATVSAGFPYVISNKPQPTVVSVPNPGFSELSSAATFTTQIAVRAGMPLDFSLQFSPPSNDTKNAIVIGSYDRLPKDLARSIKGIDNNAFEIAWMDNNFRNGGSNLVAGLDRSGLDLEGLGIDRMTTAGIQKTDTGFKVSQAKPTVDNVVQKPTPNVDVMRNWGLDAPAHERDNGDKLTFSNKVSSLITSTLGFGGELINSQPVINNPDTDILLSQSIAPTNENGVWTILTGRTDQALRGGITMLAKPGVLSQVQGETVAINVVDQTVTSSISSQSYVQVRSFSLRNSHLIIAGWFSNNHTIYGLLLMIGLIGGGFISSRLLRTVGVQNRTEKDAASV